MDNRRIFLDRYRKLGADFDPSKVSVPKTLRINTLKTEPEALLQRLKQKKVVLDRIPFLDWGYAYKAPFSLGSTPEYLQGFYYLQEAASQLPVQVLHPGPGDQVLDMAASPGSKTTQIAQYLQNKGVIVALDVREDRLAALKNNLERLSIQDVVVVKKDARFAFDLGMQFDRILLDAPCSGNFATEPRFFTIKNPENLAPLVKVQKELLKAARQCLKPGGILVYSTCSLEPEEDELVIDWFVKKFPDMRLLPTDLSIGDPGNTTVFGSALHQDLALARRLWPHKTHTQGFFIAKLQKS